MDLSGVASIAFEGPRLSGHFVDAESKRCFGIVGREIQCQRECSRGEDYKLFSLTIVDYQTRGECAFVVEHHGQDAARMRTACEAHGWEEAVIEAVARGGRHAGAGGSRGSSLSQQWLTFECNELLADSAAEAHLQQFMPSMSGRDAVVNIGPMEIRGLQFRALLPLEREGIDKSVVGAAAGGEDPIATSASRNGYGKAEQAPMWTMTSRNFDHLLDLYEDGLQGAPGVGSRGDSDVGPSGIGCSGNGHLHAGSFLSVEEKKRVGGEVDQGKMHENVSRRGDSPSLWTDDEG